MKIFSFSPFGYEGSLVAVEVDIRRGIPAIDVVGLADGAVKESRERMKSAIRNSGFEFPLERVLISLSPADLKKEGAGFDLAIALAVLDAQQQDESDEAVLVMGELELSGQLRPVRGVHAAVSTAMAAGITKCIVSSANAEEAREVESMKVFAAENLTEAFGAIYDSKLFVSGADLQKNGLSGAGRGIPEGSVKIGEVYFGPVDSEHEFAEILGQKRLIRALQIAAAGCHNLIAFGPPGCGKTLSIQKFTALQPLLTVEEAQSVTRIHSLAGLLQPSSPIIRMGAFRMPHQTASIEGMCGGGVNCRPGEISLAHNGVLFLDEAAEFKTSVLQMLRVPLESGSITLSRAGRTSIYPARFQLLMATNPCPCGNFGVPGKLCLCSARAVEMYWKKFSGPLLDRIDLRVSVEGKSTADRTDGTRGDNPSTAQLRQEIARAVEIQRKRGVKNGYLKPQEILQYCSLDKESKEYLEKQIELCDFSQRSVSGCLRLARTIADMKVEENIKLEHLQEAVSFRKNDGPLSCMEEN